MAESENSTELDGLILHVRAILKSAENAAASVRHSKPGASKWAENEVNRLRRMVRAGANVEADSDLATRMYFTLGIDFYAHTSLSHPELAAQELIERVAQIDAGAARRLKPKKVAEAIKARKLARVANEAKPQWPWKKIHEAWDGKGVTTESWRIDWYRYTTGRK